MRTPRTDRNDAYWCVYEVSAGGSQIPAARFHAGLFGWRTKVSPEYSEFNRGATAAGGMKKIPEAWGNVPPNWLVYFAVADCDAIAIRTGEPGGAVIVPPTDIPDVGRFSGLRDSQGARSRS